MRPPLPTRETAPGSRVQLAPALRPPSPTRAKKKKKKNFFPFLLLLVERPPRGGPRLEGGGGRAGKGRARARERARAPVSSSRFPPAGSPRLRNPAGTRTQRSRRQPGSVAATPPPGTRSGFPLLPPSNLPTRSPPVRAGEQPERSGLACPPPPSHLPGPETPPPPSYPDAHGRCPAQRRDRGGNGRLLPEPAAQPCRRPRPGLRGAEPSRGREDGGREAGALRSPAPPPPPAAGENCACRPEKRGLLHLGPRFLPFPPLALGALPRVPVSSSPVLLPGLAARRPRLAP